MGEYVDTKLLNCNRLASVEARTGNDSNPAVFTNPLNETVRLNVGDKVSIERSFINEIGAGNPQTIEFKGVSKGTNIVPPHTDISYDNKYYKKSKIHTPEYRLGYYRSIKTTLKTTETLELRDNLAPLIFGYYITSNEYPNYIQQPRRFAQTNDTRGSTPVGYTHYSNPDSVNEGLTHFTQNLETPCLADWTLSEGPIRTEYKQKVDNTRYTLFIKDKISYVTNVENAAEQFPKQFINGIIAEANYLRIRERKDIEVKKGFNTPSAIATQITKQLTETRNEDIFEIMDGNGFTRPITKTIETTTYKPINAQNLWNFNSANLTAYTNTVLPTTDPSQAAIDYLATFGYIGVKRPEIFEKGREMGALETAILRDAGGNVVMDRLNPWEGFQIVGEYIDTTSVNTSHKFKTNIEYTEANCKLIREFFDTQALYPELWDNLQDTVYYAPAKLGTNAAPTIDNSRFFHFNPYTTKPHAPHVNRTFGDDDYDELDGRSAPSITSVWFQYYDDNFRDTFIPPRVWRSIAGDGLSYGFAEPVKYTNYDVDGNEIEDFYLIAINNNNVAGTANALFNEDDGIAFRRIKQGRRFGYDFHATAYSTAIITPYSGYSNVDIGTLSKNSKTDADTVDGEALTYSDTINHIKNINQSTVTTDLMPYMTQTYIGANNPEIFYNDINNRFEIQRFHTSNNIGNRLKAGSDASSLTSATMIPEVAGTLLNLDPPKANLDAGDTVYKINPRPPQFGYSPTFKPYTTYNTVNRTMCYPNTPFSAYAGIASTGDNVQIYNKFNNNIRPYTAFDSHGGVYIDNWGFNEDTWIDNLWDILGFDYNAVNALPTPKNMLTRRVDNENSGALYRPTTNAEIVTTDTKAYISNQYGVSQYYTSLPYPSCIIDYNVFKTAANIYSWRYNGDDTGADFTAPKAQPEEIFDEVAIKTQSTTITATGLQKSVLRPYYTIRSDILEGATAIGGNPTGANLPIISIVDKYSGASDYFLGNPSDLEFTVTKPTVIADITTSIHDSDGRYANVDRTSAVVYKIQKLRTAPTGIIEDIMDQEKKQKK